MRKFFRIFFIKNCKKNGCFIIIAISRAIAYYTYKDDEFDLLEENGKKYPNRDTHSQTEKSM